MKKAYLALIGLIEIIEISLCYAGLLLCSFMVFAQVINRYILHYEIMWIGDLSLYFFVPMMILSISFTTRTGGHTTVDVFVDMTLNKRPVARKVYGIGIDILSVAIMLYILPMAVRLFRHALEYPEYGTLVRWFNTSWIREMVLVMIVLSIIHSLHRIGAKLLSLRAEMSEGGPRCR